MVKLAFFWKRQMSRLDLFWLVIYVFMLQLRSQSGSTRRFARLPEMPTCCALIKHKQRGTNRRERQKEKNVKRTGAPGFEPTRADRWIRFRMKKSEPLGHRGCSFSFRLHRACASSRTFFSFFESAVSHAAPKVRREKNSNVRFHVLCKSWNSGGLDSISWFLFL